VLTLLVLQGPDKGRRFQLPDALTLVGRESRALPLTDNTVSRRHCELIPVESGDWILKDLGSSNGTYVNGSRIDFKHSLKVGDQIRVGRTLMAFGAQPGVSQVSGTNVTLTDEASGMDASIMHTVASNEDSMVLAVPEPAAAAMSNLKLLYQLNASLGSSFTIDQVLEVVMDLVFEHVKADRGIILMKQAESDELETKVVRTRDETLPQGQNKPDLKVDLKTALEIKGAKGDKNGKSEKPEKNEPKIHASSTIINHVLKSGEGVLSSNAMTDKRFSAGKSVHNLGIRSALCVPIKARKMDAKDAEDILGVIYIDSSVANYTYSPDQLRLLTAIGLQAGMAIQNARLYQSGLQAERMAAIGETTAALSHSIKNILQALRGGADVVEMGLRSTNIIQAGKGWRIVDRNLERIYNLTMNLLAYSKPREPQLEAINPRVLIGECIELIAAQAAEKGAMVVADVDKDVPPVPLDADGIHQVIMNLLSNALDALPDTAGLIRVVCRYDEKTRETVLEVIDNGAGITPSMMNHMFELFHSTKGNRGTGLGLAVSKKIVEEHDGTITVKSSPAEGTTFTVRLPVNAGTLSDPSSTHAGRNRAY